MKLNNYELGFIDPMRNPSTIQILRDDIPCISLEFEKNRYREAKVTYSSEIVSILTETIEHINSERPIPGLEIGNIDHYALVLGSILMTLKRFSDTYDYLSETIHYGERRYTGLGLSGAPWYVIPDSVFNEGNWSIHSYPLGRYISPEEAWEVLLFMLRMQARYRATDVKHAIILVTKEVGLPENLSTDDFIRIYKHACMVVEPDNTLTESNSLISIGGFALSHSYQTDQQVKAVFLWKGDPVLAMIGFREVGECCTQNLSVLWQSTTMGKMLEEINAVAPIPLFHPEIPIARAAEYIYEMLTELIMIEQQYQEALKERMGYRYAAIILSGTVWTMNRPADGYLMEPGCIWTQFIDAANRDEAMLQLKDLLYNSGQLKGPCAAVLLIDAEEGFPKDMTAKQYAGMFLTARELFEDGYSIDIEIKGES